MRAVILASSSPYRRALLARLGLAFEAIAPDIDETRLAAEDAAAMVRRLARLKAEAIGKTHARALVVGSDQCALIDGAVLGKPGNFETAFNQLKRVAGERVEFHTGLCLLDAASGATQIDDVTVAVRFKPLTDARITAYLNTETPYECAGSFKSEGLGVALVESITCDDPSALIGLPLIRLVAMFEQAGLRVI